jgi:hypothetical protein
MTNTDQDRAIQRIAEQYDRVTIRQNAGPTKDRAVVVCPDGRSVVLDGDGEVIADSRKRAERNERLAADQAEYAREMEALEVEPPIRDSAELGRRNRGGLGRAGA